MRLVPAGLALAGALRMVSAAELEALPEELPRIPAVGVERAPATFSIKPGYDMELAAGEPLVQDPIAMAFDAWGSLYVAQMRGYSERRAEALGEIRLLVDSDGDGRFDRSTVFLDQLQWPTGLICWDGGVFVAATPDLFYCRDTDGDGRADEVRKVMTGFGTLTERLNVQSVPNSLTWGLDNRIHGANGGNPSELYWLEEPDKKVVLRRNDFSFDPRTGDVRVESGGAQYGMSFDAFGRKYVCSNSQHIRAVMYDRRYAGQNPWYDLPPAVVDIPADGAAAEIFRLSPDEPWRIVRTRWRVGGLVGGPVEGGGRVSGYFTAATGITIYQGDGLPEEMAGDAFIGDAGSNLIHRKKIRFQGVQPVAERPADERAREFAASDDVWFRPVSFSNGPGGALYVADMYREVIEHPWSLPEGIKKHLDLNSGWDRGRIYRIMPEGRSERKAVRLGDMSSAELVPYLAHKNGWHRDTAARLLQEREAVEVTAAVRELVRDGVAAEGVVKALYALAGFGKLNVADLRRAQGHAHLEVRRHVVLLADWLRATQRGNGARMQEELAELVLRGAEDPEVRVRYEAAFALGRTQLEAVPAALFSIVQKDPNDRWVQAAVLSGAARVAGELWKKAWAAEAFRSQEGGEDFLGQLVRMIRLRGVEEELNQVVRDVWEEERDELRWRLLAGLAREWDLTANLEEEQEAQLREDVLNAAVAGQEMEEDLQEALAALLVVWWSDRETVEQVNALMRQAGGQWRRVLVREVLAKADREVPEVWLRMWNDWDKASADMLVRLMTERPERLAQLVAALEKGWMDAERLNAQARQALRHHRQAEVRDLIGRLLPAEPGKEEVLERLAPALGREGDAVRGRELYLQLCAACHRAGEAGAQVGPDVAAMRSGGREKLLVNVVDPDREVGADYVAYDLRLEDGEEITGLIAGEDQRQVRVRQAHGAERLVSRSKVKSMRSSGRSIMPEGLADGMSVDDFADLLAFVEGQE